MHFRHQPGSLPASGSSPYKKGRRRSPQAVGWLPTGAGVLRARLIHTSAALARRSSSLLQRRKEALCASRTMCARHSERLQTAGEHSKHVGRCCKGQRALRWHRGVATESSKPGSRDPARKTPPMQPSSREEWAMRLGCRSHACPRVRSWPPAQRLCKARSVRLNASAA